MPEDTPILPEGGENPPSPASPGRRLKRLGGALALVGALGLGAVLGIPAVGLAQTDESTTTTVTDESTETTTEEGSERTDRAQRGEHDCEPAAEEGESADT